MYTSYVVQLILGCKHNSFEILHIEGTHDFIPFTKEDIISLSCFQFQFYCLVSGGDFAAKLCIPDQQHERKITTHTRANAHKGTVMFLPVGNRSNIANKHPFPGVFCSEESQSCWLLGPSNPISDPSVLTVTVSVSVNVTLAVVKDQERTPSWGAGLVCLALFPNTLNIAMSNLPYQLTTTQLLHKNT